MKNNAGEKNRQEWMGKKHIKETKVKWLGQLCIL